MTLGKIQFSIEQLHFSKVCYAFLWSVGRIHHMLYTHRCPTPDGPHGVFQCIFSRCLIVFHHFLGHVRHAASLGCNNLVQRWAASDQTTLTAVPHCLSRHLCETLSDNAKHVSAACFLPTPDPTPHRYSRSIVGIKP